MNKKRNTHPATKTFEIRLNATIAKHFAALARRNSCTVEAYLAEIIETRYAATFAPDGPEKVAA